MSNLKQINLGITQYSQDYDEKYLIQDESIGNTFGHVLQPYLKSTQIFVCPSAAGVVVGANSPYNPPPAVPNPPDQSWDATYPATTGVKVVGSYGANTQVIKTLTPVALAEIESPATKVLMADGTRPSIGKFTDTFRFAARHLEGSLIGYADGHVKWANKKAFDLLDF